VILKTAKLFLIHMTDVAQLAFTIAPSAGFCGEYGESWDEQYSAKPWR
jgi:hypothetical protein